MPTLERASPRPGDADVEYSYRRRLTTRDLIPAIGVAVCAGLFAFYLTRLMLQRTPLRIVRPRGRPARVRDDASIVERPARP